MATNTLTPDPVWPQGYAVVREIHQSVEGQVHEVFSHDRRCRCVCKMLRPSARGDREAHDRLLREGRLLQHLTHPNIVRIYELVDEPELALIIEHLPGLTLSQVVRHTRRPLDWPDLASLALQLTSALGYLHSRGWLHLDLKASNVTWHHGRACMFDLNLARPPGRAPREVGTRLYMAPEQVRGEMVDARTDVWALGVLLYFAAAGRRPFSGEEPQFPQLHRRAAPLESVATVPARAAAAINACLEPDREARPAIDELRARLAD